MPNRKQAASEWNCFASLTHDLDAWIKEPTPKLSVESKCIQYWSSYSMHYSIVLVIDNMNKLDTCSGKAAEIPLYILRSTSKRAANGSNQKNQCKSMKKKKESNNLNKCLSTSVK